MKNRKMSELGRLLLVIFMVLGLVGCGEREKTEMSTAGTIEAVSAETTVAMTPQGITECHTVDLRGEELQGYYRKEDGNWYLFVPSAQDLQEVTLYYTGEVAAVSRGTLESESCTVKNAFAVSGDQVELITKNGNTVTVVAMQSELPSVQLYLNDTTLETIHQDKDEKFKGNTLIITDSEGQNLLTSEENVEMKGRGNSSWRLYEKKGYQIKFDEKTSILGMGKAKKWVLLANASDDSLIRTQLVYRMAEQLDLAFVPSFEYVDFWVDGNYLGTYIIGEKVEIGGSRLDLEEDSAALFEHDEAFYSEEDHWFYSNLLQRHFVLKEIGEEEDSIIEAAMTDFEKSVNQLTEFLYSKQSSLVTLEELSTLIDVDSFIKYYLINEYVQNRESFATSFYWYKDGPEDVIHLGPIWDFDTCMGNDGTSYTESYGENHILFRHLLTIPAFRSRTEEIYEQYREVFESMQEDIPILVEDIGQSANMNYLRWNVLGTKNDKTGAADFHNTFEEAVLAVDTWLDGRIDSFAIPNTLVVTNQVSDDCSTMEITFEPPEDYLRVRFAVWNLNVEPEAVEWYKAKKIDGVWKATVDLNDFGTAGLYRTDIYVNWEKIPLGTGCGYVEEVPIR